MAFKPLVFVSYARKDKAYLEDLVKRLDELTDQGVITAFIDIDLKAGGVWRWRILRALALCLYKGKSRRKWVARPRKPQT